LSYIDIALILFLLLGAYGGYKEGFLMELFSVLAILLGILGGFKLMGNAMVLLDQQFNIDETVLPYLAFIVVFILVLIVVRLIGKSIRASIDDSFLGKVDQSAGAFLGIFKSAFMLSVGLWIIQSLKISFPEKWTDDAWLYPKISVLAPTVAEWISEYVPLLSDIF
jgi:membrane protein required for colicin V production